MGRVGGSFREFKKTACGVLLAAASPALAGKAKTTRVSVSSSGAQANKLFSLNPSISTDGRFVAFESQASNLVPGDTNRANDVFVHDLRTGKTRRVSVSSSGAQANGSGFFPLSAYPSISADGRFVAFDSPAPNLVRRDTNRRPDVFIHDLRTGETRLSVSSRGRQGNKKSFNPSISAAGHFVAFKSYATDLVRHDTNASRDVFVHGLRTGKTRRVSVSSRGRQGNKDSGTPSISADGRFVAFASDAPNLVPGDTNRAFDSSAAARYASPPPAGRRPFALAPARNRASAPDPDLRGAPVDLRLRARLVRRRRARSRGACGCASLGSVGVPRRGVSFQTGLTGARSERGGQMGRPRWGQTRCRTHWQPEAVGGVGDHSCSAARGGAWAIAVLALAADDLRAPRWASAHSRILTGRRRARRTRWTRPASTPNAPRTSERRTTATSGHWRPPKPARTQAKVLAACRCLPRVLAPRSLHTREVGGSKPPAPIA
jgi:WD40-like Beta Propeller Repeat